jgi:hypothetical protein
VSYSTTAPKIAPVTADELYWKRRAIKAERENYKAFACGWVNGAFVAVLIIKIWMAQ